MKLGIFKRHYWLFTLLMLSVFGVNAHAHKHEETVFEMRTYTTQDGKLDALQARFRDHTLALFEKHGMTNVGYWTPTDKPNTLIYIVSHASREQAKKSWQNFINDPQWKKAYAASILNGKIVSNIESVFMLPTDYSPIK